MNTFKSRLAVGALCLSAFWAPAFANDADQPDFVAGMEAMATLRHGQALAHFRQSALAGNRQAQRVAGMMLLYGERLYGPEIRQDKEKGLALLRQAADSGCEVSAVILKQYKLQNRG